MSAAPSDFSRCGDGYSTSAPSRTLLQKMIPRAIQVVRKASTGTCPSSIPVPVTVTLDGPFVVSTFTITRET